MKIDNISDAICIYALISTRGSAWREDYEKILKEKTEEMQAIGWVADPNMPACFHPSSKQ